MQRNVHESDDGDGRPADVEDDVVVEHQDAEEEVEHAAAEEGVQEGGILGDLGGIAVSGHEFEADEAGAETVISD